MKQAILFTFLLLHSLLCQSQSHLAYTADTTQVMALIKKAVHYGANNPDSSLLMAHQAFDKAQKIHFELGKARALDKMATAYRQKKDFVKAVKYGKESIAIFHEIQDIRGEGIASNNVGIAYEKQRKYEEAIFYYGKAMRIHERISEHESMAMNMSNMGNAYRRQEKYEIALTYYFKSLYIKEALNNAKSIAITLDNIGLTYVYQDDYLNALIYYNKSKELNEKAKNIEGIASNLNNIGNIYEIQGKYDKALEVYIQLLEITKSMKDKTLFAYTLDHIGNIQKDLSNLELALEYYKKALKINIELNDQETIPINLINIGEINRQQKHFDVALVHYKEALSYYQKLELYKEIIVTYNTIGALYQEIGNNNEALRYFLNSLLLNEKSNDKGSAMQTQKGVGKVYLSQKEYEKSIIHFQKALEIAQQIGLIAEVQQLNALLYEANKAQGDYAKALLYYEKSKEIKDSLFNIEKISKIANLESQLALGRKEQELLLLKKDGELQRLETARQKNARLATEKQAEANRYIMLAREENSKRKTDSLYALAQQSQLETNVLKAQEARIAAENNANILEKKAAFLENKRQKLISSLAIVGFILALITVFFVYKSWQNQKKAKNEIANQKEELETQAEQLNTSNQTKDRLFAIIAHDLRNPIMSFQGVAKQIQFFLKKGKPERVNELVGMVEDYSNNLNNLLDNLLNWALVQRGEITTNPKPLLLHEEITHCLQGFSALAIANHIAIENRIAPNIKVLIDSNILQTIVRNLVSNALKFTPENGTISIDCQTNGTKNTISIKDTGVGISAEKLAHLFLVEANKTTEGLHGEKGIGIGLNLCYELAKINNISIKVDSKPNQGTTFYLII